MRILLITYYWPPSGGSGVQRWLKFTRDLREHNIETIVYTPANPEADLTDHSLETEIPSDLEVIKRPIREPNQLFRLLKRKSVSSSGGGSGESGRLMSWIRGNFFIPDPRVFWVRPSVKYLSNWLRQHPVDAIITTGPPHSMHLIGLGLSKRFPDLRWIADFRDPWTTWGALEKFRLGPRARRVHRELEEEVMKAADEVVTISPFYKLQFEGLHRRPVRLVLNGFDEDDFRGFKPVPTSKFVLRHAGIVHTELDLEPFLRVYSDWANEDGVAGKAQLVFTGRVPARLRERVSRDEVLSRCVEFEAAVPHSELIRSYAQSSALLLVLSGYRDAEGFLPGKLYEYLATGLPVVAVGPPAGDASRLLTSCSQPALADPADAVKIREQLRLAFEAWRSDTPAVPLSSSSLQWSRRSAAGDMADLIFSLRAKG